MKTIVVTGYKPVEMGIFKQDDRKITFIKETIKRRIMNIIEEGLEWVLVSGQMGVELWTAELILDLKEDYDIKLGILPPFENQQERWPEEIKMVYEEVTMLADYYQPIYKKNYEGPYQFRAKDLFLVEHSDGCVVLFDEDTEGTPKYFLDIAKKQEEASGYLILYITPLDLEETVEELRMSDPDYWSQ